MEVGLHDKFGLGTIPYYSLIKDFLNPLQINYDTNSYVISVDQGYLVFHIASTHFENFITCLSLYCVISNYPVMGSITVTDFRFRSYFFPLIYIMYGPIRSTKSLFHSISPDNLSGNIPYFLFEIFVRWKVSQQITNF